MNGNAPTGRQQTGGLIARMGRLLGAAAFTLSLVAVGWPGAAQANKLQKRLDDYTVKAKQLTDADAKKLLSKELGDLDAAINRANNFISREDDDEAKMTLDLIKIQIGLIETLMDQTRMENEARATHEKADALEQQVLGVKNEAIDLERQQEALAAEGY